MNLRSFLKDNKWIFIIVIIIVFIIPLLINTLLQIPYPTTAKDLSNKEWLGFWGSFLGGCFGGIATLFAVKLSLSFEKNNKLKREREEKIMNLIILFENLDTLYRNNIILFSACHKTLKDTNILTSTTHTSKVISHYVKNYITEHDSFNNINKISSELKLQMIKTPYQIPAFYKYFSKECKASLISFNSESTMLYNHLVIFTGGSPKTKNSYEEFLLLYDKYFKNHFNTLYDIKTLLNKLNEELLIDYSYTNKETVSREDYIKIEKNHFKKTISKFQ